MFKIYQKFFLMFMISVCYAPVIFCEDEEEETNQSELGASEAGTEHKERSGYFERLRTWLKNISQPKPKATTATTESPAMAKTTSNPYGLGNTPWEQLTKGFKIFGRNIKENTRDKINKLGDMIGKGIRRILPKNEKSTVSTDEGTTDGTSSEWESLSERDDNEIDNDEDGKTNSERDNQEIDNDEDEQEYVRYVTSSRKEPSTQVQQEIQAETERQRIEKFKEIKTPDEFNQNLTYDEKTLFVQWLANEIDLSQPISKEHQDIINLLSDTAISETQNLGTYGTFFNNFLSIKILNLPNDQLSSVDPSYFKNIITPDTIQDFSTDQIRALNPAQIQALNPAQLKALFSKPDLVGALKKVQIQAIPAETLAEVISGTWKSKVQQFNPFSKDKIQKFPDSFVNALTADQARAILDMDKSTKGIFKRDIKAIKFNTQFSHLNDYFTEEQIKTLDKEANPTEQQRERFRLLNMKTAENKNLTEENTRLNQQISDLQQQHNLNLATHKAENQELQKKYADAALRNHELAQRIEYLHEQHKQKYEEQEEKMNEQNEQIAELQDIVEQLQEDNKQQGKAHAQFSKVLIAANNSKISALEKQIEQLQAELATEKAKTPVEKGYQQYSNVYNLPPEFLYGSIQGKKLPLSNRQLQG